MHSPSVGIVILAAGESQRMGRPKQLLPWQGRTLLRHAVETAIASSCGPIVVTTGAHRPAVEADLLGLPILVAYAPDWARGMSASIRAGLDALLNTHASLEGVVITLADQPLVERDDLSALVRMHRQTGKDLVASEYAGTRGVPLFVGARLFDEMRGLCGPGGAKGLLSRDPSRVAVVSAAGAAVDIDTPADYERLAAFRTARCPASS